MLSISITAGAARKITTPSNDNAFQICALPVIEQYAVRSLARRAGISSAHAVLIAELAGIVKGARHG